MNKLSLELGCENPAIVFSDCVLDKAVQGCVRSAYTNQGDVCLCTERKTTVSDANPAQVGVAGGCRELLSATQPHVRSAT